MIGCSNAVELTVNAGRNYHKKITEGTTIDKGKGTLGKRTYSKNQLPNSDSTTTGTTIKQRAIQLHEAFGANKGLVCLQLNENS
ncbi:unnamed protein product [Absidia cylindrospora]